MVGELCHNVDRATHDVTTHTRQLLIENSVLDFNLVGVVNVTGNTDFILKYPLGEAN
jgi:hypothetical protein